MQQLSAASEDDQRFMAAAISLGARERGRTWPNPAVGALVVKDGAIVGRGWTQPGGRPHAEPMALAEAGEAARGATLYVSLEPCSHHGRTPPCTDAVIAAGIARVVTAMEDPNPLVGGQGHARLRAAGIEVTENVGEAEARSVHAGHISLLTKKRPHVLLKLAVSSNGKAGFFGRLPATITGEAARRRVHMLRSCSDAIVVGSGTVNADDPLLTCRLPGMEDRSPLRVVFDSALQLRGTSRIVMGAREVPVWVVAGENASDDVARMLAPHGIEVIRVPRDGGGLNIAAALETLGARGVTRLMVEGGPLLAASFLRAGLVDDAVIFQSAKPLPDDGVDALDGDHREVLPSAGLLPGAAWRAGADAVFEYGRA